MKSKAAAATPRSFSRSQRRSRKAGCAKCFRTTSKNARRTTSTLHKTALSSVARKIFRDLVIESQDRDAEPSPEASACLAQAVANGDLTLNQWNDSVEQWIARVNFLAGILPEHHIPKIGAAEREYIVHLACEDATNYREIKDRPILNLVRSTLTPAQQQLVEKHAPERLELPGGRRAKVTYAPDSRQSSAHASRTSMASPTTSRSPAGRVPLIIHVLAPITGPFR